MSGTGQARRQDAPGQRGEAGPVAPTTRGLFDPEGLRARIQAVAYGAVASLPPALRVQAGIQYAAGSLPRLTDAMSVWSRGSHLPANEFAERFLGRTADDPVAQNLRRAAVAVAEATDYAALGEAASNVAGAMQAVGIDRWPRFLAEAHGRTLDAATLAAIARPAPARADQVAAVPRRLSAILGSVGTPVGAPAASLPPPAPPPPRDVDHEPKDERQEEHHREHPAPHVEDAGHDPAGQELVRSRRPERDDEPHDEALPPGQPPPDPQEPPEEDARLPEAAADEPSEPEETSQPEAAVDASPKPPPVIRSANKSANCLVRRLRRFRREHNI